MDCLKSICEQHLCSSLSNDTVSCILLLSDMHSLAKLKSKCIEHILNNAKKVMATDGWKQMVAARPDLLAQLFAQLVDRLEDQVDKSEPREIPPPRVSPSSINYWGSPIPQIRVIPSRSETRSPSPIIIDYSYDSDPPVQ